MAEERADEQGSVVQVSENANWDHVQRMFPYQAGSEGLGRVLRLQASSGTNPVAEVRLKSVTDKQRYDHIVCGLLSCRGEYKGSCFPLTPVVRQKAVWMTCQHVTKGGELKMSLSTNHNMRYPKDVVRHSDIVIRANTHINLQHNTVPYPSDPSQTLRLWEHGDVATFEVVKYGTCEKLDQYIHFFIPFGQSPAAGEMVTCIGYPGPLTLNEASRILATEEDYREHVDVCKQEGNAPLPTSEFKLDLPTTLSRKMMMDDPTDGVYVSDVLNASPGEILAADDNVVQYKCTTLPQMSGCPCVLLEKPFKLVAIHTQGGGQLDRNFSFGVSVKHIEFVRAYVLTVLPKLQKDLSSIYAVDSEAIPTLRGYLQAVDDSVERLQLRHIVNNFLLAVQDAEASHSVSDLHL